MRTLAGVLKRSSGVVVNSESLAFMLLYSL